MIGLVLLHAEPWMPFMGMAWGAGARAEQVKRKFERALWIALAALNGTIAVAGIIWPHLIRWEATS